MYSFKKIINWLKTRIETERRQSLLAIAVIFFGFVAVSIYMYVVYCPNHNVRFAVLISKVGGLGISVTSVIGVVYYMYKYDGLEDRRSNYFTHLGDFIVEEEAAIEVENISGCNASFAGKKFSSKIITEIIEGTLKSKLLEKVDCKK